jgi:hypothetical protein
MTSDVVLVGDFLFWLIRMNPVYCISPEGETISIIVASDLPVKYCGGDFSNESEQAWGPYAVTLGGAAGSPERFPARHEGLGGSDECRRDSSTGVTRMSSVEGNRAFSFSCIARE